MMESPVLMSQRIYILNIVPVKQVAIEISASRFSMRDFQTWLITQVTAARGAACQFPSELPVCPGCSVYNSQAAEQVIQAHVS